MVNGRVPQPRSAGLRYRKLQKLGFGLQDIYQPFVAKNFDPSGSTDWEPKAVPAFFGLAESQGTGFESEIIGPRVECGGDKLEGCQLTRKAVPFETAEVSG